MSENYPLPPDEPQRLEALRSYQVVDTAPEAEFDHIARIAADLFRVPTALVSFVEADRQFFKAHVGIDRCETPRNQSFCAHALSGPDVLVIPDTREDPRFRDNPLVTGDPHIRFYAGSPLRTPAGHTIGTLCIIDVLPRPPLTEHETSLLRSLAVVAMDHLERRRLDILKRAAVQMASATPDAIICTAADGRVGFWNRAAERLFGYTRAEALGRSLDLIIPPEYRQGHSAGMDRVRSGGERRLVGKMVEITAMHKDGSRFPVELSLAHWVDGGQMQFGSIIRDVSERHRVQERMRFLTQYDRLTNLPNRVRFLEKIDEALQGTGRFTVFKIGLDRFKTVNGSMAMSAGDSILLAAAKRVTGVPGADAFVARLGGDEFGVIITGSEDPVAAARIANGMIARLGEPFDADGVTCHLGASIGIVLCPGLGHFDAADAVLKAALLALQHAKKAGGRRYELFRPQLGLQAEERHRLGEELRDALVRQEFQLHFQPQVRLGDGQVVGAEALLRWQHPARGLLAPGAFIGSLETSPVALAVGDWIVRQACTFAAGLRAAGHDIRMGVNLFGAQLQDPKLFDKIAAVLSTTGLPAGLLELEITETTVLGLDVAVIEPLRKLRELGVGIAFDDYGTGFASLSLLKRYPLSRLKIDREFVRDLETDPDDAAIVKAVLAMGRSLGLDIIAEGIETAEQALLLRAFGCQEAQGYHYGRPVPGDEFRAKMSGALNRAAA